jgi:S-adenosylhomocysteine hydrolase
MVDSAYDVKDMALASAGLTRIRWADGQMPVLRTIPSASGVTSRWLACALGRVCT